MGASTEVGADHHPERGASTSGRAPRDPFQEHAKRVYGWAYRLLGRHDDAMDVVQDVFVKWQEQVEQAVPAHPRGWLRRVTMNRAIDMMRRRRKSQEHSTESAAALEGKAKHRDDGALRIIGEDREILRRDVAEAMEGLSDMQRGVLAAKVFEELTFAEIAEELALGVSTVKTHYLRALSAVRDRLRPRWKSE